MDTAEELEQWLRNEAETRLSRAASRRGYARAGRNLNPEDRKAAHAMAEQLLGRSIPKTDPAEDEKSADVQDRIASKLEREAAKLLRFADFVYSASH